MPSEENFWVWFNQNQERIFNFEQERDVIFDLLHDELKKVHSDLVFEISSITDGKREFVLSADGIREAFPSVESLFSSAPSLPKWKIVKFRPRIPLDITINFGEKEISAESIMYSLESDNGKVGIMLFVKDYEEKQHEDFVNISYLFLDSALGEYDVETKVGFVEVLPLWAESKLPKKSFKQLPEDFDKIFKSLSN
jgi:hypothetical protein